MPLQWKVSHLDHMVVCVSEGAVTLKDFQEYLAALLTSFLEIDGLGPFAVVAGSKRNDGLTSVFRSLATVRRPMRLFPDIHAARKWLDGRSSS